MRSQDKIAGVVVVLVVVLPNAVPRANSAPSQHRVESSRVAPYVARANIAAIQISCGPQPGILYSTLLLLVNDDIEYDKTRRNSRRRRYVAVPYAHVSVRSHLTHPRPHQCSAWQLQSKRANADTQCTSLHEISSLRIDHTTHKTGHHHGLALIGVHSQRWTIP